MVGQILVAYGSWAGSAADVAEEIGHIMADGCARVDIIPARDAKDLACYDAVIIGSAIHSSRLHPDVLKFIANNRGELASKKVAIFIVCLTLRDDDQESQETASSFLNEVKSMAPELEPVATGLFAGAMIYKKLPLAMRLIVKAMKAEEGDYRDWDAIREWAISTRAIILAD